MTVTAQATVLLDPEQAAALTALANGIIPPDEADAGAAAVNAGARLAEKICGGLNAPLYLQGLRTVEAVAQEMFGRGVVVLSAREIHELLAQVRERAPGFFKQLRMDVAALYLSDAGVWKRIGFPGPSTLSGGYPDFDQPQTEKITHLKEPPS
jgi:hypothetical protein